MQVLRFKHVPSKINGEIKLLEPQAVPYSETPDNSGLDLVVAHDILLEPYKPTLVPHGYACEIPEGFELQIRPRSSTLIKRGVYVQFGTIDNHYRGELLTCAMYMPEAIFFEEEDLAEFNARIAELQSGPRTVSGAKNPAEAAAEMVRGFAEERRLKNMFQVADALMGFRMGLVPQEGLLVKAGERISQIVLASVVRAGDIATELVGELGDTTRGSKGIGSSGL